MPDKGDLTHFKWWTIEFIASLIVIGSYVDEFRNSRELLSSRDYWILYSSIASTVISMMGFVVCILPIERKACGIESLLVWFIAILRSVTTTVGIIGRYRVDVESTLVSNYRLLTYNPNVYFFSLWAMMASILMVASWYKEFISRGNEWKTSTQWILLGAMSLFTMLSGLVFKNQIVFGSLNIENDFNISRSDLVAAAGSLEMQGSMNINNVTTMDDTTSLIRNLTNSFLAHSEERITDANEAIFEALVEEGVLDALSACETATYSCVRLRYIIGLSATTAAISCLMAPLKGSAQTFQTDVSIILFLLWFFGLPWLTVTPGPATRAGNLYFGIYISYFLVLHLFVYSVTYRGNDVYSDNDDANQTRESQIINRGDLWQAAYKNLERTNSLSQFEQDDYDSCASLFEEKETWDEDLETRLSQHTRASSRTIEQGLAASGVGGRRLTTFYTLRRFSMGGAIDSSLNKQGSIGPKGWQRRVRRLKMWFILLTMGIVLTHALDDFEFRMRARIVPWTSIFLSCVGLITCFRTSKIAYGFQITSIILALGIWVYGAVIFVGNKNAHTLGFASPEDQVNSLLDERITRLVADANFFFGVWISVITTLLLVTNICRASLITTDWLLFAIASVALLVSSSEYVSVEETTGSSGGFFRTCETDETLNCEKFKFAMYLATASLCVSLPMALLFRFHCGPTLHVVASIPLVIVWGFGVPYVTFTNARSTPAAVYFAFWAGIFLTFEIASINIVIMRRRRQQKREEELAENEDEEGSAILDEKSLSSKESEQDDPNQRLVMVASASTALSIRKEEQNDSLDRDQSVEALPRSFVHEIQEEIEISTEFDGSIGALQESFADEIQQNGEKSIGTRSSDEHDITFEASSRDEPQINIESDISSIEHRSEPSKASSGFLDSFEQLSEGGQQNHSLLETSMTPQHHLPVSSIESNHTDTEQNDLISVDTGDFEDCFQFDDIPSAEFHSARPTIDDS